MSLRRGGVFCTDGVRSVRTCHSTPGRISLATYDDQTMRLYVNGTQVASSTLDEPMLSRRAR